MDKYDEILRSLGRIEGRLTGLTDLADRVSSLERWQAWLRGGWAILAAAYAHLCRTCRGGFGIVLVVALVALISACAIRYTVHPGALNKTDSVAYDALLVAQATIDQARQQLPPDATDAKAALNALIRSYDIARESWLTYRGALTTNVPPQAYLEKLNQNLSDLSNAIRNFEEAK